MTTPTIIIVTERFPYYVSGGVGWVGLPMDVESYDAAQKEFADQQLKRVQEAADKIGVSADLLHVENANPADAILEAAVARGCSLIVMSSHGRRGVGRLLLGSQTNSVLTHSPVPVLVVR
ncbi:universal stress protein [Shinella sp. 838]|uniref:universal stress protein n=1 Tax=unclassified Shinella TaxID=2643062 RepID=UPI000B29082C|nr:MULTISPECIES: universal stress protein [unclassified Shinella]MDG4676343.1 universal stress protein [Shinella sp. 838]